MVGPWMCLLWLPKSNVKIYPPSQWLGSSGTISFSSMSSPRGFILIRERTLKASRWRSCWFFQASRSHPQHHTTPWAMAWLKGSTGPMIRTPPKSKAKWPQMLQLLTFCCNCIEHETALHLSTWCSVESLISKLTSCFKLLSDDVVLDHNEFVLRLKKYLREAVQIAQRYSQKEQTRHARLYNRKVKGSPLNL